jgi:hypothetical protein
MWQCLDLDKKSAASLDLLWDRRILFDVLFVTQIYGLKLHYFGVSQAKQYIGTHQGLYA